MKKSIRINEKNTERLAAVLDEANGRAWRRTIGVERLRKAVQAAYMHLKSLLKTNSAMQGTVVRYSMNEDLPGTYQHADSARCTYVVFRFNADGTATLTEAGRVFNRRGARQIRYEYSFTEKQCELMLWNAANVSEYC